MNNDSLMTNDKDFFKRAKILENVFDNAQVAIVIADNDLIIHHINHEFIKMFGYTSEEAIGLKVNDLIMPEDRILERSMKVKERVYKGDKVEFETTRIKKNGTIIDVECRVSPIIIEDKVVFISNNLSLQYDYDLGNTCFLDLIICEKV